MLIVVVIIGILAAAIIPRLQNTQQRTRDAARTTSIRDISSAINIFAQDHSGQFPKDIFQKAREAAGVAINDPDNTNLSDGKNNSGEWSLIQKTQATNTVIISTTDNIKNELQPYIKIMPSDPHPTKGIGALEDGSCYVGGDSFGYTTDGSGKMFAVTANAEAKRGNTTACKGFLDGNNNGDFQTMGANLRMLGGGGEVDTNKPGIYYVGNDIIVTDGENVYIIANKNVGANSPGTGSDSYGHMFQWGNDFGFPNTGHISLTRTTQVDTTGQTSYSNNVYVTSPLIGGWQVIFRDWSKYQNNNLRQGRGPCDEGYHIPTKDEWGGLYNTWKAALSGEIPTTSRMHGKPFRDTLLLPRVGSRSYAGTSNLDSRQGYNGSYWSSTPYADRIYILFFSASVLNTAEGNYRASAISLRCFKDK